MRTMILFGALVWATSAAAVELPPLALDAPIAQAPTTPPEDDEDDPSPGAKPAPAETKKPEEKKEAPAMGAVTTAPPPTDAQAQKLVSGAPLYNPNVAVHIVEQKAYSDNKRSELILFPVLVQINGKFTQHIGIGGGFTFHLQENFGFQISGYYNPYAEESPFNNELVVKTRQEAQAATSLLNTWGALAGVEVTPIYGKFAFFDNTLAHFSIVLSGGMGLGGTRHQLKPPNFSGSTFLPATYGDTGLRFLGGLGGGFRLRLGQYFAFRLEVRDVLYTARVDNVNGCTSGDLKALDNELRVGGTNPVTVSAGCKAETFGVDPGTNRFRRGDRRSDDVPLANSLVRPPISSDVLNNLGLYLGVSFLF